MLTLNNPRDYDMCVAIDVSKKSFSVTYGHDLIPRRSFKMPADPGELCNFFQKRFPQKRCLFVYEAGPTGYGLFDTVSSRHQRCMIVHPAAVKKAPNDRVKNDPIDSRKLYDQTTGGQLHGIRVPSDPYRQLRHLATTRQQYAEDAQRAKQRIKSLLLFENIQLPIEIESGKHWSRRYRQSLREIETKNETLRFKLDSHLDDLEHSCQKILKVHKQLLSFYGQQEEIRQQIGYLRSIPGFGFVVSSYLLSRVGDPKMLRSVRELGAFVGVVPSEHSSGERTHKGRITHMGDKTLRWLLVQASWIAIRKDQELRMFYDRIRSKNSPKSGPKIAIVAVARKLAYRAHRVLKEQRTYQIH
jgi:transposase